MKLLNESEALKKIQARLELSNTAKLAVAFWGAGAIKSLGLDRPGLSVEILCNLQSGACNPEELRRLYNLPGVTLKSDPTLHAKVYWTPRGVILGSSNASTNGLAVEEKAANSWHEANVLLTGCEIIDETEKWFDSLFTECREVSLDDIADVEELWRRRSRLAPTGARKLRTLLAAFRANPDHPAWSEVKVAFATDPLEETPDKWLEDEKALRQLRSDVSAYNAAWREEIRDDQWVIDFAINDRGATYRGIWRTLPAKAYQIDFPVVYPCKTLEIPSFGSLTIPRAEQQTLRAIASEALDKHGDEGARNAIVDLATAMALVSRVAVPSER